VKGACLRSIRKYIRKLASRSGTHECELCRRKEVLEEHHINGRAIPDADKEYNKTYICSNCHTKVHMNKITINGWVMTTSGRELDWHKNV
jgi:hypothetical protein